MTSLQMTCLYLSFWITFRLKKKCKFMMCRKFWFWRECVRSDIFQKHPPPRIFACGSQQHFKTYSLLIKKNKSRIQKLKKKKTNTPKNLVILEESKNEEQTKPFTHSLVYLLSFSSILFKQGIQSIETP